MRVANVKSQGLNSTDAKKGVARKSAYVVDKKKNITEVFSVKLIKTVKKILALSTGAVMVGATLMSASAANLNEFPSPWVQNGKFNGIIVVGDTANSADVLGSVDIATRLQYDTRTRKTGQLTGTTMSQLSVVGGEAWRVGTSSNRLEVSERGTGIYEAINDVADEITYLEMPNLLADGTFSTVDEEYDYSQLLKFEDNANSNFSDPVSRTVVMAESDNSANKKEVGLFFYIEEDDQIARYALEFDNSVESDITDSDGDVVNGANILYSLEGETITILGKDWNIVKARTAGSADENGVKNGVKLTLMGGAASDSLSQGASKTYKIRGKTYDVTLDLVNGDRAKFLVNGEVTRSIKPGSTFTLDDGSLIGVREVIFDPFAQGTRIAEFYIGANKVEFEDQDITDSTNGEKLVIGTDKMKSAEVRITGDVASDGNSVEIDTIELEIRADESVFLPAGSRMSEQLEEPEVLLDAWDIEYSGLETANVEEIVITASDDDQYKLEFVDGSGEGISVPLLHAIETNLRLGGDSEELEDLLVLHEAQVIKPGNYFVVSDASQDAGDRETYVLQYEGAEDEEIDFAIVGGNDKTEDYDFGSNDEAAINDHIATIDVSGKDYRVYAAEPTDLDVDDFPIKVDLNGDETLASSIGKAIVITTNAGATITITGADAASFYSETGGTDDVVVTIDEGDEDAHDNRDPTSVGLTISADAGEVDGAIVDGHKFEDRNDDSKIAYTTLGALVEYDTRNDAPTLRIDYPLAQRLPRLFVVTPEVQISGGGDDGEMSEAGLLVYYETTQISAGTARLAREVGDITAQNSIVLGGPCANTAAAILLDNPEPCGKDFSPNTAIIKLIEHDNGNVALLVAGYDAIDTRRAARVVAEYGKHQESKEFVGMELEITGTSFTNINIAAPGGQ